MLYIYIYISLSLSLSLSRETQALHLAAVVAVVAKVLEPHEPVRLPKDVKFEDFLVKLVHAEVLVLLVLVAGFEAEEQLREEIVGLDLAEVGEDVADGMLGLEHDSLRLVQAWNTHNHNLDRG